MLGIQELDDYFSNNGFTTKITKDRSKSILTGLLLGTVKFRTNGSRLNFQLVMNLKLIIISKSQILLNH